MKKILLALTLFVGSIIFAQAQQGEIISTDFGEGITVHYKHGLSNPPINLDLDQDGTDDFIFHAYDMDWGFWMAADFYPSSFPYSSQWSYRLPYEIFEPYGSCPIYGDTIKVGDTIANIEDCWYSVLYRFTSDYVGQINDPSGWIGNPNDHYYISVRIQTDDGYCYGWIDANLKIYHEQYADHQVDVTVFRTAYCTIPNYPLRIGQTSLDWGTEETDATAFANLHPNPTSGQVTITGKDLTQAEVLNTLGQCVATTQGQGETLQINIANLPTGIYFVRVTDEEGRKCVRKVVKE